MSTQLSPLELDLTQTEIGKLSPTSWDADESLSYDEWEAVGQTLQTIEGSINWWVGDWLNFGERKYGETYAQAIESTGWAIQRLKDAKWVSANVPRYVRSESLSWTHHRYVAHLDEDDQRELLDKALLNGWSTSELRRTIKAAGMVDTPRTSGKEWGTPPDIIYDAHTLMGGIDLDVASSDTFNKSIKAAMIYSKDNDGLTKPWFGRVWCHPPSGMRDGYPQPALWAARVVAAYKGDTFKEGLLLTSAATGADWFQDLWQYPIVFLGYRVHLVDEDGVSGEANDYHAIVYFGHNVAGFANVFAKHGPAVTRFA